MDRSSRSLRGVLGIFGHGNVAGIGEALQASPDVDAVITSRGTNRRWCTPRPPSPRCETGLSTLACTSSIGPGATNMLTGAAGATINRVPVLLLPGDIFAGRRPAPVLQQLESSQSQDVSVNDCFKPVSRYWDRINRPEQIVTALPEAMRVLTSPAETGAVTLALPQDVQAEAYDYPAALFEPRIWTVPRRAGRSRPHAGGGAPDSEQLATDDRRRRRRDLQRSDGRAAAVRRRDGHRSRRDAGGQRGAARTASADARRRRRHRHARRQSPGPRRRPRDRHWIAAQRLHHRVENRVSARARAVRHDQRRGARRRKARRGAAGWRREGRARGAAAAARRLPRRR